MRFYILVLIVVGVLTVSGCKNQNDDNKSNVNEENGNKKSNSASEEPVFLLENRSPDCGITGTYRNGGETEQRAMLETLGGGVGVTDYDLDGQLDCFFNGGGTITKDLKIGGVASFLYRNLSGWKFADQTIAAGIDTTSVYNHGCQWGDLDNDGFSDLVVTGFQKLLVFRNLGDGSFEVIDCGVDTDKWGHIGRRFRFR